jgi:hypothetical protein
VLDCGPAGRTSANILDPGDGLLSAEGCRPDNNTQAVLITRNGVGQFDGRGLLDYLNGGGVVITEYNASDEIYNAIFGANVQQGGGLGGCSDSANPPVRDNLNDPFWIANGGQPVEDNPGCGFDMSQWGVPMVRLGGTNANNTSLAYVDVGAGRLWLVEADWSDGEDSFGEDSRQMMRYMILNGGGGVGPSTAPAKSGAVCASLTCPSSVSGFGRSVLPGPRLRRHHLRRVPDHRGRWLAAPQRAAITPSRWPSTGPAMTTTPASASRASTSWSSGSVVRRPTTATAPWPACCGALWRVLAAATATSTRVSSVTTATSTTATAAMPAASVKSAPAPPWAASA